MKDKPVILFSPWHLWLRPALIAGWLACLAVLAFCIQIFFAADRHSHVASDPRYGIFPFLVSDFLRLRPGSPAGQAVGRKRRF